MTSTRWCHRFRASYGFLASWLVALLIWGSHACAPIAPASDCADGFDNDGDGLIDDADFGCQFTNGAVEADPPVCDDGRDNDGDGFIDLDDIGCDTPDDPSEQDPIRDCNDGYDNDQDGLIDFPADPGCDTPVDETEFNLPACYDDRDNDGDGLVDYPQDPGCEDPDDADETTPLPLPMCFDGQDNDADGLTDFPADPGCEAASDGNEFNVTVGECGPTVFIEDITLTREAEDAITGPTANELSSPVCAGFGGEFAYTYQVSQPTALRISTDHPETWLDTVVYVRAACLQPETELGCSDDDGVLNRRSSVLNLPLVEPGTYFIIVDAFSPGSLGGFRLTVEELAPLGSACDPMNPFSCIDGLVCRELTPGSGETCELPVCSDGTDNDMDGLTDYPDDPGCATPGGDDEMAQNPVTECSDGQDNDMDGLTDYPDDPDCDSAADDTEST